MYNIDRLMNTYSIVALEKETGRIGVAVQTHWYVVGPIVSFAATGVGGIATQANADPTYGPLGLDLMRSGKTANEALQELLSNDADRETRQVAMIDATGNVAVHTGNKCVPEAGHRTGETYSVQANMMRTDLVPDAMAKAYEETDGDLLERIMSALEAAEEAGGDIRGRQSASILIVHGPDEQRISYTPNLVDLRVDDNDEPILEMRRLVKVYRGYRLMLEATALLKAGNLDKAEETYQRLLESGVTNLELIFRYAVELVNQGYVDRSLPIFTELFAHEKKWLDYIDRLSVAGFFPSDASILKKVKSVSKID
jgi:uncharacterized Ntn-hydrolase superfamily protein